MDFRIFASVIACFWLGLITTPLIMGAFALWCRWNPKFRLSWYWPLALTILIPIATVSTCTHHLNHRIDLWDTYDFPHSDWVIENRGVGSISAMDMGRTEIVARNKKTGEESTIIAFDDHQPYTSMKADEAGRLVIEFTEDDAYNPKLVKEKYDTFGGIPVVYQFTPTDPIVKACSALFIEIYNPTHNPGSFEVRPDKPIKTPGDAIACVRQPDGKVIAYQFNVLNTSEWNKEFIHWAKGPRNKPEAIQWCRNNLKTATQTCP